MGIREKIIANTRPGYKVRFRDIDQTDYIRLAAALAKKGHSLTALMDHGPDRGSMLTTRNEVKRIINDLTQEMRGKLDSASASDLDAGMDLIEMLGLLVEDIDEKVTLADIASKHNRQPASDWREQDGKSIRVLGKNDRLSEHDTGPRAEFGFGEYVRAMVSGSSRPEVRNALSEGTDSAGGYTVPRYLLNQLIDAMRARTVCVQAGALTVVLEGKEHTIARIASDPTAGWRLENADVAESDPTFAGVVLAPQSLAVLVKVSRELIDDSLNLEEAMMMAFAGSLAAELDRVCLVGSGTTPEPRGIFNTSGINVVSMGTNGAALTSYGKILDAVYEVELDNAPEPSAMVMHPRTKRVISGFADTTGQPLQVPPALGNVMPFVTTNMPINQTHGTANNASAIIVGDFAHILLGMRQGLRVEVLRESFANKLQYGFLAHLRFDVAVTQPAAFCAIKGIIP